MNNKSFYWGNLLTRIFLLLPLSWPIGISINNTNSFSLGDSSNILFSICGFNVSYQLYIKPFVFKNSNYTISWLLNYSTTASYLIFSIGLFAEMIGALIAYIIAKYRKKDLITFKNLQGTEIILKKYVLLKLLSILLIFEILLILLLLGIGSFLMAPVVELGSAWVCLFFLILWDCFIVIQIYNNIYKKDEISYQERDTTRNRNGDHQRRHNNLSVQRIIQRNRQWDLQIMVILLEISFWIKSIGTLTFEIFSKSNFQWYVWGGILDGDIYIFLNKVNFETLPGIFIWILGQLSLIFTFLSSLSNQRYLLVKKELKLGIIFFGFFIIIQWIVIISFAIINPIKPGLFIFFESICLIYFIKRYHQLFTR